MRKMMLRVLLPLSTSMISLGCGADLMEFNEKRKQSSSQPRAAEVVYCEDLVESDTVVVGGNYASSPMTYPGYREGDCIPSGDTSPVVVVDPGRANRQSDHSVGQRPPQGGDPIPPFTYPGPGQGGPVTQNSDLDPFYY